MGWVAWRPAFCVPETGIFEIRPIRIPGDQTTLTGCGKQKRPGRANCRMASRCDSPLHRQHSALPFDPAGDALADRGHRVVAEEFLAFATSAKVRGTSPGWSGRSLITVFSDGSLHDTDQVVGRSGRCAPEVEDFCKLPSLKALCLPRTPTKPKIDAEAHSHLLFPLRSCVWRSEGAFNLTEPVRLTSHETT